MTKPIDDLEATRQVAALLEPFGPGDRERIIRWVREKLGMDAAPAAPASALGPGSTVPQPAAGRSPAPIPSSDLRAFVQSKGPKNDTQFAATIAYYHRFVAPEPNKKDAISPKDLMDACRVADWKRPSRPRQTMLNAFRAGVFDKSGHGNYKLNSVGENLVAMVLPGGGTQVTGVAKPARKSKTGPPRRTKR